MGVTMYTRWFSIVFVLLVVSLLPGCPNWLRHGHHGWHGGHHTDDGTAGHGGDGDGVDEGPVCELDADCDDAEPATLDMCTDGECDSRPVTYADDIQPVFAAKCAPCHVDAGDGMCAAGACLASSYDAIWQPSRSCDGEPVGECARVRIDNGSMPRGRGCTGDPVMDAMNTACLTEAEHILLDTWIAGGLM